MEKVAQQFIAHDSNTAQAERIAYIEPPQVLSLDELENVGGGDGEFDVVYSALRYYTL